MADSSASPDPPTVVVIYCKGKLTLAVRGRDGYVCEDCGEHVRVVW